jgi:YD repeat-containing protein
VGILRRGTSTGHRRCGTPTDRTVAFGYDDFGRLASVTDRAGAQTTFQYATDTHLLTRIVNPNGHASVTNGYRDDGRIEWQEDAVGNRTTFEYVGNTTIITLPPSSAATTPRVELTYDELGRLIRRATTEEKSDRILVSR